MAIGRERGRYFRGGRKCSAPSMVVRACASLRWTEGTTADGVGPARRLCQISPQGTEQKSGSAPDHFPQSAIAFSPAMVPALILTYLPKRNKTGGEERGRANAIVLLPRIFRSFAHGMRSRREQGRSTGRTARTLGRWARRSSRSRTTTPQTTSYRATPRATTAISLCCCSRRDFLTWQLPLREEEE